MSNTAVWYHNGMPPAPIRWVLVRDPSGDRDPQAFLCTDLDREPAAILGLFVCRWRLETTFQEARQHLGVETQRQWSDLEILRTIPALLGLYSLVAKEALDRIGAFYAIKEKARFAPTAERVVHRRATAPLLDGFFDWAGQMLGKLSGKLELAQAFRYTIARREALTRFVTDGRLEADNNTAENAMRIVALGRKNYLFAGSDRGGERAASIYTLVQTAKLNGLNPDAWLRDTLTKIADGHTINRIGELLPWNVAAAVPAP